MKATTVRLQVQHMGQNRPTRLDFCRDRDQRSPAVPRAARIAYKAQFADLVRLAAAIRHKGGPNNPALWQKHPERRLETLVVPEIDREVLGIDERWREDIRIVFRKRG